MKEFISGRVQSTLVDYIKAQAKAQRRTKSNMLEVLLAEGVKSSANKRLEAAKKAGDSQVVALLELEIDKLIEGE